MPILHLQSFSSGPLYKYLNFLNYSVGFYTLSNMTFYIEIEAEIDAVFVKEVIVVDAPIKLPH